MQVAQLTVLASLRPPTRSTIDNNRRGDKVSLGCTVANVLRILQYWFTCSVFKARFRNFDNTSVKDSKLSRLMLDTLRHEPRGNVCIGNWGKLSVLYSVTDLCFLSSKETKRGPLKLLSFQLRRSSMNSRAEASSESQKHCRRDVVAAGQRNRRNQGSRGKAR